MPRQGRFLEILVAHLQEFFGPEGIQVKSPEIFFDKGGNKIGEIDVTLRSDLGTSQTFVGIECRDRPSEPKDRTQPHGRSRERSRKDSRTRPQGRDWIREIQGKKEDLQVQKMIAVSSTGFTQEAIDLAKQFDIDLLYVSNVNKPETKDWFQTVTFAWHEDIHEIVDTLEIDTIPRSYIDNLSITGNTPFLRVPGIEAPVSIAQLIERRLGALFAELPSQKGTVSKLTDLIIDDAMDAEIADQLYRVVRMRIPLKLTRETYVVEVALSMCKNLCNESIIALSGNCRIKSSVRELQALVLAKKSRLQPDKTDIRCLLLDSDNKPYVIPPDTTMSLSLYGIRR
jgi:hypothetical protein